MRWFRRPHGAATAAAADKPRRSVFVYIPNGVNGMTWQITKPGRDYELSASLKPLAEHRDDFTVFSGLHHPNGIGPGARLCRHLAYRREDRRPERAQVREHHLLRPADGRGDRAADALRFAGTIDQLRHRPADATPATLAFSRDGVPLPAEDNPRIVFNRLFGAGAGRHRRATRPARQTPQRARCRARRSQIAPLDSRQG